MDVSKGNEDEIPMTAPQVMTHFIAEEERTASTEAEKPNTSRGPYSSGGSWTCPRR